MYLSIIQDRDFKGGRMVKPHNNPPAKLFTSLSAYQLFLLERAYKGEEIFWAKTPKAGDVILITFTPPVVIGRYGIILFCKSYDLYFILACATKFCVFWPRIYNDQLKGVA